MARELLPCPWPERELSVGGKAMLKDKERYKGSFFGPDSVS
jgi:hypothetical protein